MGIQGLLVFLKPLMRKTSMDEFRGKTIGIDAMCWMHKGAFTCARELIEGKDTDKFILYFIKQCEILRYYSVKPVIVFDGAHMPAKEKENKERGERRGSAREEALDLIRRQAAGENISNIDIEKKCQAAIRVTSEMIERLMQVLRELDINFLVSPYEADAQLAFLCRTGWVHTVISEDSDLLAFGCPKTFYKMDSFGNGEAYELPCLQLDHEYTTGDMPDEPEPAEASEGEDDDDEEDDTEQFERATVLHILQSEGKEHAVDLFGEEVVADAQKKRRSSKPKKPKTPKAEKADVTSQTLAKWTADKFTEFCVLCGTDYKEEDVKIKGLGPKTAFQLLSQFPSAERMIRFMRNDKKWSSKFPCGADEYLKRFRGILAGFWHHNVFNPRRGRVVSIADAFPDAQRELPDTNLEVQCGKRADKADAQRIYKGEIDPRSGLDRNHTGLTAAERRCLDDLIARQHQEQQRHQFDKVMRAEGELIHQQAEARRAAEKAAFEQAQARRPAEAPAPQQAPQQVSAAPAAPSQAMEGFDPGFLDPPEEPRAEMVLKQGDINMIQQLMSDAGKDFLGVSQEAAAPPPKAEDPTPDKTSRPAGSNPFARSKRTATDSVLDKRPRLVATPHSLSKPLKATTPVTPGEAPRQWEMPEAHHRGGAGRSDAVEQALAQRGLHTLKPLAPELDRRKISSFLKQAPQKKEVASVSKPSSLAGWTSRPWEEAPAEDADPFKTLTNPLAFDASRMNIFKRSWK